MEASRQYAMSAKSSGSNKKPQYFQEPSQAARHQLGLANDNHDHEFDAVIIRNLTYEVGRGRNRKLILNKINLTVPEGSIYGLLGPSGCGKTTMLRCLVGRVRARSGSVLVFGFKPGDSRSQVPGRHVGYMPQEISIYEDFTIEETLIYFGKINRLHMAEIEQRIGFLVKFLDLPPKWRLVVSLSGGQKRRVSLAAALVHSPPLLILDEPTVGVDPLLRQGIWRHLVGMTQTERISVIITTHYIEEARQANVVGLMRHGKILAEDSPDELMQVHQLTNLEDVFLKLCMTDSARRASASSGSSAVPVAGASRAPSDTGNKSVAAAGARSRPKGHGRRNNNSISNNNKDDDSHSLQGHSSSDGSSDLKPDALNSKTKQTVRIHTATNRIEYLQPQAGSASYTNETLELSSADDDDDSLPSAAPPVAAPSADRRLAADYLDIQALKWSARRSNALSLLTFSINNAPIVPRSTTATTVAAANCCNLQEKRTGLYQWWRILLAVTWKNYIRLRRNPPVLMFQFMLPAIQVILFCLCIGGEPFDVPLAVVNDESRPHSSLQFLDGLNRKVIRQIKYDNLSSAMEAVRRGHVWGALHIPDKYSQNLQSRLIMGEEANSETLSNGTIRVYPDLTNLHLALALETTFRESFLKFAQNSLEELGYDRSLASLPIQLGKPVYGSLKKDSYLEFMAPGVVISISYVMATGLTALAFILERRDGLLERSLVSGVDTSQILLAHAINQVVVMVIQIFLVLGCTFFVFEIPSRGPFFWVVLLILLQGCTGMAFGLLVSAICKEENTAVMMLVGSFYTNFILAGIIWPIEAMPHWLRPLSYAQPQTLPTDTLRHILSRGWGITETGVLIGFAVTIGWLAAFLLAAGLMFKYSS